MAGETIRSGDDSSPIGVFVAPPSTSEPSLGEIFSSLTSDMSTLVRKEVELAKTETIEKVSSAVRSIIFMVAGGLLAYAGLIGLIIAIIVLLDNLIPLWMSALIVGLAVIVIGAILLQHGLTMLKQVSLVPEKTIESIKESTEWAKEQVQ